MERPVAVAYEAGPTGFGLYRSLTAAGIRCEVLAPSELQKPAGDRVKTDAKDAIHLARLLRLDEFAAVVIPTVDQEAARDLGSRRGIRLGGHGTAGSVARVPEREREPDCEKCLRNSGHEARTLPADV